MNEAPDSSRRAFLKAGLITGALAAAGLGTLEVLSQTENKPSGDTVKLLSPDGKIVEVDKSLIDPQIPEFAIANHIREGVPGKKFVMVIDLSRCKNAGKCRKACSKMHYLPQNRSYVKIERMQDSEKSAPYWMPMTCFHCDNPPCTKGVL
ncbi:MAG: twin-arginine translocation signal domain-containing protein [Bacteroidetes bacterium]|nr:twin-arginine translocation signal domain-containing protein [Bacteroidota bacterium]